MRLLAVFAILVSLAGCGNANRTYSYTPPPTPGGRLCSNQCHMALQFCHETCDLQQRSCVTDGQTRAMQDYDRYMRDQFTSHEEMDLLPRDFERLEPCDTNHDSCINKCENGYSSCYENCGGKVSVTTSCEFLCF